ncbi:hypothetical protein C8R45DRAFT_923862 [Mycena sanguinolenta]|nr:hypothetical protein C8R45DRAFT_923862 [Mycena sanguinolenta]
MCIPICPRAVLERAGPMTLLSSIVQSIGIILVTAMREVHKEADKIGKFGHTSLNRVRDWKYSWYYNARGTGVENQYTQNKAMMMNRKLLTNEDWEEWRDTRRGRRSTQRRADQGGAAACGRAQWKEQGKSAIQKSGERSLHTVVTGGQQRLPNRSECAAKRG